MVKDYLYTYVFMCNIFLVTVQYIAITSNTFPLHANNFKQTNHNITIMSLNILADFILRTGKSNGQISVSFQNLSV